MESLNDWFAIAGQICLVATGITALTGTTSANKYINIVKYVLNLLAGNVNKNKNEDRK